MKLSIFVILGLCAPFIFCFNELAEFENNLGENLKSYLKNVTEVPKIENFYVNFICARNISSGNISALCAAQMDVVCNNPEILSQMADAWSKFPYTGMLVSSRQRWGTFDQCIAIDYHPEDGPRVLGKHCANGLVVPASLDPNDYYLLAYCLPDGCSALDLVRMVNIDQIPESTVQGLVNEIFCATKETNRDLDAPAITIATIFCFFLALMILSTAYDALLHTRNQKAKTPLLTAFSVFTNGQKLLQTTHHQGPDSEQILVFHGLKVISMMWIVAGHNAAGFSILPVSNREKMAEFQWQRYSLYLLSAYLAVDSFFYISGFLLAYQYFKGAAKKPVVVQVISVPKMIIHRYLRITPAVLMAFLYAVYLAHHIGSGPIFSRVHESTSRPCKEHWWAVFLYIQNYYTPKDMCMVHLWYLSADWQLFLISPLILIPMAWQFRRRFNSVLVGLLVLNIFVMLLPLYTKLRFPDYDPEYLEYDTHSKLINYFMGITFGFYMRCQRHKPYIFKGVLNTFMWSFSTLAMFAAIFTLHEVNINHGNTEKAFCYTFVKPVWCAALTFIIYSCINGKGGIINWMMSSRGMQILSKLTFCMYIMHVPIIYYWVATRRTQQYFSDFNLFFVWCGQFIITIIVSVIWTLAFESPLITVERFLLGGPRKPRKEKPDDKPKASIEVTHKLPYENSEV